MIKLSVSHSVLLLQFYIAFVHTLSKNSGFSTGTTLMNMATWANITPYMVINLRAFTGRKSLAISSFESPVNRYQFRTIENVTKHFVPAQFK